MIGNKKILAIITARAGSKGVPGKNFRELMGMPLFLWSMKAAEQSKYVDGVILSSNCERCLQICEEYIRAKKEEENDITIGWIKRPEEYSTDVSKNEEALIHALDFLAEEYDTVINLQPTSPCRTGGLLDKCIEKYHSGGYDSLLTANKDTPFLWRNMGEKWEYPVDKNDCCNRKMRQEFEEHEFLYHDNGNIYIVDSKILLDKRCRIGYNPYVYETQGINSLQIDSEFDFDLIEQMSKLYKISSLV